MYLTMSLLSVEHCHSVIVTRLKSLNPFINASVPNLLSQCIVPVMSLCHHDVTLVLYYHMARMCRHNQIIVIYNGNMCPAQVV